MSLSCGIHWVIHEVANRKGEDFALFNNAWEDYLRRDAAESPRLADIKTQQILQVRRGQAGLEKFLKKDSKDSEIAAVVVTGGGVLNRNLYNGLIATAAPFRRADLVPIRVDPPSRK
jgi:hypothetical protein